MYKWMYILINYLNNFVSKHEIFLFYTVLYLIIFYHKQEISNIIRFFININYKSPASSSTFNASIKILFSNCLLFLYGNFLKISPS